jgi:hypothetical protein
MSKSHVEELDKSIQFSLVTKIRHAANTYRAAPASSSAEALDTYLAALESLAEYVGSKWRGECLVPDISTARKRLRVKQRPHTRRAGTGQLIPFTKAAGGSSTPFTAA